MQMQLIKMIGGVHVTLAFLVGVLLLLLKSFRDLVTNFLGRINVYLTSTANTATQAHIHANQTYIYKKTVHHYMKTVLEKKKRKINLHTATVA